MKINGLRDRGNALTNQMWLLYVTFEDFVCLTYPEKTETILSARVDINNYFNKQTFARVTQEGAGFDNATRETCENDKRKANQEDEHRDRNELKHRSGEVIINHRFARKRLLQSVSKDNSPSECKLIRVNGVIHNLNNIGSDRIDMPHRDKQKMYDRKKKDLRSNVTLTKDYGFCNSWRTRHSGDIIRNCQFNDQAVNHGGSETNPRNKPLLDNGRHKHNNPPLKLTNRCLNRPADLCGGLSPCNAYPQDENSNKHLNLSCSATNTPLSSNLTKELDWHNNILNVSAFNPGDSKSARFRLKLDLQNKTSPRSPRRACSKEEVVCSKDFSADDLPRSASFDNVLTPEQEMPSKALSCESSPMTISSGYESDSLPTNEADIDNIFVQGRKKENGRPPVPPMDLPIDYFSMSDSHPSPHGQPPNMKSAIVTRKPETFVQNEITGQSKSNRVIKKDNGPPAQQTTNQEKVYNQNPAMFSPAQINNYQLTKVARSMFEIIHDLQLEKDQENKGKSRKPKRHVQWRKDRTDVVRNQFNNRENENVVNTSVIQQENCEQSREGFNSTPLTSQGKVSVKCLRRPLGSDPTFQNRQFLPHSSEFDKPSYLVDQYPENGGVLKSSDHYPEFSRQFSEPEMKSDDGNRDNFPMNHSFDSRDVRHQIVFDGCAPYATTRLPGCSPYATTRLPGCQTPRREEDHVYETIPGDDLLQYEEILRMRLNGLLPHKYLPPALPARNINDRKMSEPCRTDLNFRMQQSNFLFNPHLTQNQNVCGTKPMPNEEKQQFNKPRSFSYDPSDAAKGVPNEFFAKWSAADLLNYIDGIRQPPAKRRENFYFLLDSKQKRACFSESLEIENKIKGMGIHLEEGKRSRMKEEVGSSRVEGGAMDMPPPFRCGLHNMQSTYV